MASKAEMRMAALRRWMQPDVPSEIAEELRAAQIDSLTTQVPVLLAVAGLNAGILMAACVQAGLPFINYGWMSLLILYTLVRGRFLRRQFARVVTRPQQERLIRGSSRAALGMLALLGIVASTSYATQLFAHSLLIPMSLGFGSISIAHCLYRLRPVAMGALGLGILPSAGTLILAGDFQAQMLGVSMITVAYLMMRFVAAQYDQLIDNLQLQHSVWTMANSDPLTGLANRRAVTAFLERQSSLASVGLAIVDLNDFKQVNDRYGHDVGDALIQQIGRRLQMGFTGPGLVGRLGGDEFVVIFEGVTDEAALAASATRLIAELANPVQIDQLTVPVGASIGYALGTSTQDMALLMKRADKMLYVAKRQKPSSPALARALA
jgi:diguanylate cyclase (GGDEF)-like protein